MGIFMENRVYPNQTRIRLYEAGDGKGRYPRSFLLERCIGTGAGCVAYQASEEDGIPVRLKQYRPAGMERGSELYRLSEARFLRAYSQQIEMMRDEKTAAVTAGLCGLFRDGEGWYWTSVNAMAGRVLSSLLSVNTLHGNLMILRRLAESVRAYHEAGWLLLDVKPANVLVIDSLGLKGINFFDFDSFVRVQEIQDALREHRQLLFSSSEAYSAPELLEQAVDLEEIGPAADRYSLGAILFEALFGRAPELFDCIPGSEASPEDMREEIRKSLSREALRALSRFLRHTLTLSPEDRYGSDAELLEELNLLLRLTDPSGPVLVRSLPGPVRDFCGRERELQGLCAAIRESDRPLWLWGMAGIGKTQLALRAAEMLAGEFDFTCVGFRGTVRSTLLSLPFEKLSREVPGEDGVPVPRDEEELWQEVLACLRRLPPRTVLIIDNFDAADDEETAALRYDPDLPLLEGLPFRLLFTTRTRFEGVRCFPLGSLEKDDSLSLLRRALPGEAEETLQRLADAAGGHTLTLRILSDTARESRGRLRAEKLLSALETPDASSLREDAVTGRLRGVFRAAGLSRSAASVLACATLFPLGGLNSDLLLRLFSREQWAAAARLERCGWLQYDPPSGRWTIHPIVRLICRTEKQTALNWENAGRFVTALRDTERSGGFDQAGPEERAQLEALFAAVGKLNLRRRLPRRALAAAAAACLVLLGVFLFFFREKDDSPIVKVEISPSGSPDEAALEHDSAILLRRLNRLGFRDAALDGERRLITGSARSSTLGDMENLINTVSFLSAWPGELYAVGETDWECRYLFIPRDQILEVKAEYGSIPGLDREQRKAIGLTEATEYHYLSLRFSPETAESIRALAQESDRLGFATDVVPETTFFNTGRVQFSLSVPGTEENTWYLADGSWTRGELWDAAAALLKEETPQAEYKLFVQLDPAANWENPDLLPRELLGLHQCGIDQLTGDTAVMYFRTLERDDISDAAFQEILDSFRDRLDQFGLPYALGTGFYQPREVAVCISPELLCQEIAKEILPADRWVLTCSESVVDVICTSRDWPGTELSAEIETLEDGSYALRVSTPSPDYLNLLLQNVADGREEPTDGTVYLSIGSTSRRFLATLPGESFDDGSLLFVQSPVLGMERFGDGELILLRLIARLVNDDPALTPTVPVSYFLAARDSYLSEDADFGIRVPALSAGS